MKSNANLTVIFVLEFGMDIIGRKGVPAPLF